MSTPALGAVLRSFTAAYATRINAHLVQPAGGVVVKPNELGSALARPMQVATYRPDLISPAYLASTLAFSLIKGIPITHAHRKV
jgi:hypothetical protein